MVNQSSTLTFYRLENGLQTLVTFSILYKYVGSDNLTPVSGTSTAQRRNYERLTEKTGMEGPAHSLVSIPQKLAQPPRIIPSRKRSNHLKQELTGELIVSAPASYSYRRCLLF